jgi:mono/diheme cytochrome c family protein
MKSILRVSLLILLTMPSAYAAALPGDSADGKRLHDANCMGCHDKTEFSAIETQNIIKYLNDQFYQFR